MKSMWMALALSAAALPVTSAAAQAAELPMPPITGTRLDQCLPLARQAGVRAPRGARSDRPFASFRRLRDRSRLRWLSPPAPV